MPKSDLSQKGVEMLIKFIKDRLEAEGYSQKELVRDLERHGYSRDESTVSRLLAGRTKKIDYGFIWAIAKVSEERPDWLPNPISGQPYGMSEFTQILQGELDPYTGQVTVSD